MSTIYKKNYLNMVSLVQAGNVKDVSEERFDEMLGAVPPERMVSNAFLVGEPVDHDRWGSPRYEVYFRNNGRCYYGGVITTADFDSMLI